MPLPPTLVLATPFSHAVEVRLCFGYNPSECLYIVVHIQTAPVYMGFLSFFKDMWSYLCDVCIVSINVYVY